MNLLINHGAVCRTALATLGLLLTVRILIGLYNFIIEVTLPYTVFFFTATHIWLNIVLHRLFKKKKHIWLETTIA